MTNSEDPDQLASKLIWIYTVCKGRTYPGSAGLQLVTNHADPDQFQLIWIYTEKAGHIQVQQD